MLVHLDTMIGFATVMLFLSLVVTVVVQLLISLVNMRGWNLAWGIERAIAQADPDLKLHAKRLAKRVLKHEAVSTGGIWKQATAIRFDELVAVLGLLAKDQELFPDGEAAAKAAKAAIERIRDNEKAAIERLETWYDMLMDRTTERFVRHTKVVTGVVALLLSWSLIIDSVDILKQVSSDSSVRAKLVQSSDAAMKVADDYKARVTDKEDLATAALARMKAELQLPGEVEPGLRTRREGKKWIDGNVDALKRGAAISVYERHYDVASTARVEELTDTMKTIKASLDDTKLVLFHRFDQARYESPTRDVGVLLTALLLSLGAPFWYNLLRQASALRPILAGKIDQEKKKEGEGG